MVTSKKSRRGIGGSILYQILELSFKDFIPIKVFLSVQGSCCKQQRLLAVIGGRWWWKMRLGVLGEGLGEKMGAKCMFYVVGRICMLQDSSKQNFSRLGELAQLRLAWVSSVRILLQHILLLLLKCHISHSDVIWKIPMVKTCKRGL